MSEAAGVAQVDIVGNIAPLNASLNEAEARTRASIQNMVRTFNQLATGHGGAARSTQQLEQRMERLSQTARDGASQFTRVRAATQLVQMQFGLAQQAGLSLTQTFGAMQTSIGLLGSVIVGNLVGQALVSLGRALIQSTTQFAQLQNEMATVTALSGNVGAEFQFVQRVAGDSNIALKELSKSYTEASKAAHELGVSQEFVRESFEQFNTTLASRQQQTVGSSASKFLDTLGATISGLDRVTGISTVIVGAFNGISAALQKINSYLPVSVNSLEDWKTKQETITKHLEYHNRLANDASLSVQTRATHERTIVGLKDEQVKATAKIKELEASLITPEMAIRRKGALQDLNAQILLEGLLIGRSNATQEVRNRMHQIDLQFRQMGVSLSQTERVELYNKLKDNALLVESMQGLQFEYQTFMDRVSGSRSVLDEMNFSWFTHADAVEAATARIKAAYGDNVESQRTIADIRRQLAMQEQRQMMDTATAAATAITSLWPKQKGAAIAAAVINTAVGVTKALSGSLPPWNFAQAALVAAAGAGQIAAIRSASPSGGGGIPSVTSGGATPAAPAAPAAEATGRAVTIYAPRGELYSSETMMRFIERLNEEVQNGATIFATKMVPT